MVTVHLISLTLDEIDEMTLTGFSTLLIGPWVTLCGEAVVRPMASATAVNRPMAAATAATRPMASSTIELRSC